MTFASFLLAPAFAHAHYHTEWRTAYIECGGTQVRALAECYANTRFCISETLTFQRRSSRAVVGLHKHYDVQNVHKLKVPVLNYTASEWACAPGSKGGRYLLVKLERNTGGSCSECTFEQLYYSSGQLAASRLSFDDRGRARENADGSALLRRLTERSTPHVLTAIYTK